MKKKFLAGTLTLITAGLVVYFISREIKEVANLFDEDDLEGDEFDI